MEGDSNSPVESPPRKKPVDIWLSLAGTAVGIVLYLLPKTPLAITLCLVAIFGLFLHPVWNFWWIEGSRLRQWFAILALAGAVAFLGFSTWPRPYAGVSVHCAYGFETPSRNTLFVMSDRSLDFFARGLTQSPWGPVAGDGFEIGKFPTASVATCVVFNDGEQAVFSVTLAFAYRLAKEKGVTNDADMTNTVPVLIDGRITRDSPARVVFINNVRHRALFVAPTLQCGGLIVAGSTSPQSCALPKELGTLPGLEEHAMLLWPVLK